MSSGLYEGLTSEGILNLRSLEVLTNVMDRSDLVELLLHERKQNLLNNLYIQILCEIDNEPNEMGKGCSIREDESILSMDALHTNP